MIYHSLGRSADCRTDLENIVKTNPGDPSLYHKSAMGFAEVSDFANALEYEKSAVKIDPGYDIALLYCGLFAIETKQYAQGTEFFKSYLKLKRNNPQALVGLAVCCHALDQTEEEQKSIAAARKQEPLLNQGTPCIQALIKNGWVFYPNETAPSRPGSLDQYADSLTILTP